MAENQALIQFLTTLGADRDFSRAIVDAIEVYGHGWAESNSSTDADEDGYYSVRPSWPGYQEFFEDIEISAIFDKAVAKATPAVKALYEQVGDDLFEGKLAEQAILKAVPEREAEDIFEDAVKERWDEMADSASYARDPYAYYGLSRRDFMASSPLRREIAKLAFKTPEMRRHVVPILRRTAARR